MKILDVSSITDTSQLPIKKGTLQFLQDAHKEVFNEMLIAQLNGVGSFPYVLNGMFNLGSGLNYAITAGSVFDPNTGEVFLCDGGNFTASVGQVAVVSLVTTQYGTYADPVTFTDGVTRNVHNIRKIQVTAGTAGGSGTADYICDYGSLEFSRFAIPEIASQSEVNNGTNDVKVVTPLTLTGRSATETRTGIAELATLAEVNTGTDDARMVTPLKLATTPTVLHVDGSTIVRRKIIDIGDWDMDGTANLSVAHAIGDFKKIRSVQAFVRNDTDTIYYPLNTLNFGTGTAEGGVNYWDSTIVRLGRITGGLFDSADFNATSYNRGYIVIEYTE